MRRRLGAGGFGTVYEAIDRKFGGRVAVKVLDRVRPETVYRFKREFRSIADVVHVNLVRLYELVVADDTAFFTMEIIDGRDILAHVTNRAARMVPTVTADLSTPRDPVRRGTTSASSSRAVDVAELRSVLAQLAGGVQRVHDAEKLHCDIKPSNVLVSTTGRLVLLDFGLVADRDGHDERRRGAMGTPGYSAPEQARGAEVTPAADWYSVGVILHEALTGVLPGDGAESPHVAAADDLMQLARDLLVEDPQARPTGQDVLRRLGSNTTTFVGPATKRLFGRSVELAVLRNAWRDITVASTAILVRVEASAGIGKSALVETFLDELPDDALVLRGRCYEHEAMPYKALDPIVDALGSYLRGRERDVASLLPPSAALLGRLFPALGDTLGIAPRGDEADSQALRRQAFQALRELLTRIAQRRPVVCFLDDLQWGDRDSARLLFELLRPPDAPRVMVVVAHRPDATAEFLETFSELGAVLESRHLALAELSTDDANAFAEYLLEGRSGVVASSLVRETGSPLFLQELAARVPDQGGVSASSGLADVILARVGTLGEAARRLLEVVAIAGQPVDEVIAVRASAIDADATLDATLAIRHARLVNARLVDGTSVLEASHDRVREALVESLTSEGSRDCHRRVADALVAMSSPDPERLVHHYQAAGDRGQTRHYATLAADRADDALAFDRAAGLRGLLVSLAGENASWDLHERHAQSLAHAGRAIEAADAYERAADGHERAPRPDAARLHVQRRLAGELTLRSGRLQHGENRMQRVLREVGVTMPRSRAHASWLAAGRRLRLFVRGYDLRDDLGTPAVRRRLETLFGAWSGIVQMNHVVGDALALQLLQESLASGNRSGVVRGLGIESVLGAIIGGSVFRRRSRQMLEAITRLAADSDDPYDRAFARQSHAGAAWFMGEWESVVRHADAAIDAYRTDCRGASWEIALCEAYRLPAIAYLGDLSRLAEIVPRAHATARERGDLFAANTLRLGQQSMTFLAEDRASEAIAEADHAIAPFPTDTYLGPHYHHLFAVAQALLYAGRPREAWIAIERAWPGIEQAKLLRAQCLRVEIRHLRARAAIATAVVDPAMRRRLLSTARSDASKIARDAVPPAAPLAAALEAAIAAMSGDQDRATEHLISAMRGFEHARMSLHASAAKLTLGELLGGSRGHDLQADASRWLARQPIKRPEAMVRMLVPGFA